MHFSLLISVGIIEFQVKVAYCSPKDVLWRSRHYRIPNKDGVL